MKIDFEKHPQKTFYQIAKMYQIAVQEVIKAYEELRSEQNNERNV